MKSKLTPYGKEIRKIRIDKNISASDHASKLGVTTAFLSNVERGKKPLPIQMLFQTFEFFKLNSTEENTLISALAKSAPMVLKIPTSNPDQAYAALILAQALLSKNFNPTKLKAFLSL